MSGGGWGFNRLSTDLIKKIAKAEGGGYVPIQATYFRIHTTGGGDSGTITPPEGFAISLDSWPDGVDALVVTVDINGRPTYTNATTALGAAITIALNGDGTYTLSATPGDATVAIIYRANGFFKFFDESVSVEQFTFDPQTFFRYIEYDDSPGTVPDRVSVTSWAAEDRALQTNLGNGVLWTHGAEEFFDVENKTGAQIDKGTVVMFGSAVGSSGNIEAVLAVTDGTFPSDYLLGIATEDIANGTSDGKITWRGKVRGIDTSAWAKDTILYPDPTTPGGLTSVEPEAPNLKVPIAVVLSSHVNNGILLVRPNLRSRVVDCHDVQVSGLTDQHVLAYAAANGRWENKTAAVQAPLEYNSFIETSTRSSEVNLHGALNMIVDSDTLSAGVPVSLDTGTSKLFIVPIAGADVAGSLTITGDTVDRTTGVVTPADSEVITVDALAIDATGTDSNGNILHDISGGYMTTKWFRGAVSISTTDLNFSDVDIYQVAFDQFNDRQGVTLDTLDTTFRATNAGANFNAHMYTVTHDDGPKFSVHSVADIEELAPVAERLIRRKVSGLGIPLDGTAEGIFVDCFFDGSVAGYFENINIKVRATVNAPVNYT